MGNIINLDNLQCQYNMCTDDIYELDWFSNKTWNIELSDKKYNDNISINKGKIKLSSLENTSILFHRKINIVDEKIYKLLIPLYLEFYTENPFEFGLFLTNEFISLKNLNKNMFLTDLDYNNNLIIINKHKKINKLDIFSNSQYNIIFQIICDFMYSTTINTQLNIYSTSNNHINNLNNTINLNDNNKDNNEVIENTIQKSKFNIFQECKTNLLDDHENINVYIYFKINKLENNEFIKIYLS